MTLKRAIEHQSERHPTPTKHGSASDVVHRIIPLGLTLGEARAWYVNRVLIPRLRWATASILAGFVTLLLVLTEPGRLLEQSLTTRMVAHDSLFLVAGFLFAYGATSLVELMPRLSDWVWEARNALNRSRFDVRALSILTFGSAAITIGYWYLPAQFNATAGSASLETEMYLALLFAGSLILVGASFLTRRLKLIGLVIVGKALGLYGMFLLLTPWTVYPIYPGYDQVYAGATLLFFMLILDFTIMPAWLYNYFGKGSGSHTANVNTVRRLLDPG